MPNGTVIDRILSTVADEQEFLASILSAEADKAAASAALITPLEFPETESPNTILGKALSIEDSIAEVIGAMACKEFAIALKVAAVLGNLIGPINLTVGPCVAEPTLPPVPPFPPLE
ncbi:MAG: hypothetical protein QM391_01120 [Bacillota bacterium]|jgi:hypothetical protein|nr:hypothetical protein [Bacillota bacterium]MDI9414644.1 hypothetical protein [Bacillota bacterium]NLD12246.1 hypothetical protein [Bacillota bacterium]HOB88003.1 hypothetical protein [Bacillota bacterium]HOJ57014.1 hypothetical protein [Bacillota bacterium]